MSKKSHDSGHDPVTPGVKYEFSDANVKGIIWFGVGLVVLAIVTDLLMRWTFDSFANPAAINLPDPTAPVAAEFEGSYPRRPLLEGLEDPDLFNKRNAADKAKIASYGWVDQRAGIVRIPIEQAMEMVRSQLQVGDAKQPLSPRLLSRSNSGRAIVETSSTAPVPTPTPSSPETSAPAAPAGEHK